MINIACNAGKRTPNPIIVDHRGALKNMMHHGDISSKIDFGNFENE